VSLPSVNDVSFFFLCPTGLGLCPSPVSLVDYAAHALTLRAASQNFDEVEMGIMAADAGTRYRNPTPPETVFRNALDRARELPGDDVSRESRDDVSRESR